MVKREPLVQKFTATAKVGSYGQEKNVVNLLVGDDYGRYRTSYLSLDVLGGKNIGLTLPRESVLNLIERLALSLKLNVSLTEMSEEEYEGRKR